jgi:hypothetical protein
MRRLLVPFVASLLVVVGCGPSELDPPGDYDGSVVDQIDASDGERDAKVVDAFVPYPDATCGAQTEEIELINLGDPPDLLIVLDRSGSMLLPPNFPFPGDPDTKWTIMTNALTAVTGAMDGNIRFGMSVFPSDNACAVDSTPVVAIDIDQGADIAAWMSGHSPDGNTPAHWGLEAALDIYAGIPINDAGRYVLFATDGVPNCGGDPPTDEVETKTETVAAVTALANAGIKTYVLGFGAGLTLDAQLLNDAAQAGEVPLAGGPPYYYGAEDSDALEAVLIAIAGGIIVPSCSYELVDPPPDPDAVMVIIDGVVVPRSTNHTNGWDYHPDANTITFFGSYCTSIEAGDVINVEFIYGCPGPVVD